MLQANTPLATAFAVGEHLLLTCEHVIRRSYGGKLILDQHGSKESRKLRINKDHVALAATQDIAFLETKETLDHYLALADTSSTEPGTRLSVVGRPPGHSLKTLRSTDPVSYRNEVHFAVATDAFSPDGLSGSPVLRDDGKVVGIHCHGGDNMIHAVKVEQLRRFLNGRLPRISCRHDPSLAACIQRATKQLQEIAEAGDPVAQFQLSLVTRDPEMLAQSALAGFAVAQHRAGQKLHDLAENHFRTGREANGHKSLVAAARWYKQSAEQGYPLAITDLATALYEGYGVFRDLSRAFRLFLEAAKAGDHKAHFMLGEMYVRGHGTARDEKIARQWFQGAIDRGDRNHAQWEIKRLSTTRVMRVVAQAEVRDGPGEGFGAWT